jgi:hypothetical protein
MEAQAGRFERQAAVRQQAADVCLRIAYQLLILQMHDSAGQDFVPVIHERKVRAVVPAEMVKVVTERLSFREVLLVGAEARIDRVASRVDNGGVRQNRLNERDMAEIVGHLVDKVRSAAAKRARLIEVTPT